VEHKHLALAFGGLNPGAIKCNRNLEWNKLATNPSGLATARYQF
jgi:hypothetical protein